MNRPIRRVALVAMLMTFALLANVCVNYLARGDSLNAHAQNRRVTDAAFAQDRGAIMVGNTAIAETVAAKDQFQFQRHYPQGELYAPVTGYFSYLFGSSELEQSYGSQLSGNDDSQFVNRLIDLATGAKPKGASIQTTLNAKAQQAAAKALGNKKGAVVALNPKTGAILAMVSSPSFDPNDLATHKLDDSTAAWKKLTGDSKNRPMANRATREIFPPGSTFKVIVSAAALEAGYEPDSELDTSSFRLPGSTVTINTTCGDRQTLRRSLALSCNSAFARLGVKLGANALREQAEKFGFGTKPLSDIGSVASRFPDQLDEAQTGLASIGGFDVAATPLQMAMVSAAVRNDGIVMQPYLVESVRSADLQVLSQTRPSQLRLATSSANAAKLRQMMVDVVANGTGWRARVSGVTVGGKTGTANSDNVRTPYAWFTAWAEDPDVAVCAFVQDAEMEATDVAGGRVAAPIAKAVIEALR
ncbi:MAG: penicillin-binding protein 2 [Micropruina sp.]|uniref:peptidoglycan D,D-transpeptidase FtsI family protein n=1 Tax=Micropruina sp. TaxID=2737536 RepID=UPI0039E6713A